MNTARDMSGTDVKSGAIFVASFLGTAVVVVIILALTVLYYDSEKRLEYERYVSQPYAETEEALLDQRARLQEYEKLADVEEQGQRRAAYRIPIDRAMEKVLADWKSGALPGPVVEAPTTAPGAAPAPKAAGESSGKEQGQ
jgi:hypothetical protein